MKTFLPSTTKHGKNSCVLGKVKFNYYPEISFCGPTNPWFDPDTVQLILM